MTSDILFHTQGRAGIATLNKPESLNAVTGDMVAALNAQLDVWQSDASVDRILIKAVEGRAFSAGGDIRHLYDRGIAGTPDFDFFAHEYRLNARIAQFPKPYIALVDGIVMGGGVGVSFHGSHRVAGENITFAMPEVGIGFFPDVGASHILSRLPGFVGLYLALTGERLKQADAVSIGLASHGCPPGQMAALEAALCEAEDHERVLRDVQTSYLEQAASPGTLPRQWIDQHFSHPSITSILASLDAAAQGQGEEAEWAASRLQVLQRNSPTSLEIAFRQITRARDLDIVGCMEMEYRVLRRMLVGNEFYEGIRAAIIDKDRQPKWQPPSLNDVDLDLIEAHFEPLGELELFAS